MSEGLARNTLHSSIAGLIYSLGRFLTTVVLARTVGVHDTGVVNYVLWIVALAGALTDMGAYTTLSRYLPEVTRDASGASVDQFVRHLFWPFVVTVSVPTLLSVTFLVLFYYELMPALVFGIEVDTDLLLLVTLLYLLQVLANFALGFLQGMQRFRRMVVIAALAMSLQISIVGAAGLVWGANGALLGYMGGCAIPAIICLRFAGPWEKLPEVLRIRVHRFAAFSWASTIASALVWGRLETAFLNYHWGSEAVGLYSVGFTLASLAVQAPLLLTGALLPYFSGIAAAKDRSRLEAGLESGTRFLAFVTLPLTFITAAIVPQLLELIFGPEFLSASTACSILVIGTGLWACSSVATNLLVGLERSDFIFFAHLTGAFLSVVLSLLLIPPFGIFGAAITRVSAQLYIMILTFWFVRSRIGFHLPLADSLRLLIAAVAAGSVAYGIAANLHLKVSIVAAVLAGAAVYLIIVRLTNGIHSDDARMFRMASERLPPAVQWVCRIALAIVGSRNGNP